MTVDCAGWARHGKSARAVARIINAIIVLRGAVVADVALNALTEVT